MLKRIKIFVIILVLHTVVSLNEQLFMHSRVTMAVPGQHVWFMCTSVSSTKHYSVSITREAVDGEETYSTHISTNDRLHEKYARLKRFKAEKIIAGRATLFVLHIHNVTYRDTGNYVCYDKLNNKRDSQHFEVYKPPSAVVFVGHSKDTPYEFREGEPQTVQCDIHNVFPSPKVHIYLGEEDITHVFEMRKWTVVNCDTSEKSDKCPPIVTYNVSMTSDGFLPNRSVHEMNLVCESLTSITTERLESTNTSVPVMYKYSPKTSCAQYQNTSHKTYIITCNMSSYPLPTRALWKVSDDDKTFEILPGISSNGFKAEEMCFSETLLSYSLHIFDSHYINNTMCSLNIEQEVANEYLNFTLPKRLGSTQPAERHFNQDTEWPLSVMTLLIFTLAVCLIFGFSFCILCFLRYCKKNGILRGNIAYIAMEDKNSNIAEKTVGSRTTYQPRESQKE